MIDSPSIVPDQAPAITPEQERFMWLHAEREVMRWRWHPLLGGEKFRAYSECGATATISKAGLDGLIAAGLMHRGGGADRYDVHLTDAGKEAVK